MAKWKTRLGSLKLKTSKIPDQFGMLDIIFIKKTYQKPGKSFMDHMSLKSTSLIYNHTSSGGGDSHWIKIRKIQPKIERGIKNEEKGWRMSEKKLKFLKNWYKIGISADR